LPYIQLILCEEILEALMIGVNVTLVADQIVPPNLESMNNCGKLKVMCGVVHLMIS
jgi:hypothetical protein